MKTIKDIVLYDNESYWVTKAKHGFEVYKNGLTHSTRCAIIGYDGELGLKKAIDEANRRLINDNKNKVNK